MMRTRRIRAQRPWGRAATLTAADADAGARWLIVADEYGEPIVEAPPPVSEQVRYIVERLRLNDADGLPPKIGVTSALAGEGASTVARTLAAVLAGDADREVCLVGLDWWTTGPHATDVAGMAQVVTGEADTSAVLQRTSSARLAYVPAGWADPAAVPELVRSTALSKALIELGLRFHTLVLELPPVRATSAALALAGHCDACALVVRHGATARSDVQLAIDNLGGDRLLGVIVHQASSRVPTSLLRAVAST